VLKTLEYGFPEIMRERLAEGRPSLAIVEDWVALARSLDRDPEALTAALQEAAQVATGRGSATVAPRSAFGVHWCPIAATYTMSGLAESIRTLPM